MKKVFWDWCWEASSTGTWIRVNVDNDAKILFISDLCLTATRLTKPTQKRIIQLQPCMVVNLLFFSFFLFSSALVFFFFLSEHSIPEYEHALVLECDRSAAIEARGVNSTL